MIVWQASGQIVEIVQKVKEKYHHPRLEKANVAVVFNDGKAFIRDRFNWGKTQKFSNLAKLFHPDNSVYDFMINICDEAWMILDNTQKEALIDLHLCRCQVEYVPAMVAENGVEKPQKDEWGRIQYTDEVKLDEEGNPKWKIAPLDLLVFEMNVSHFGCWCTDLVELKSRMLANDRKVIIPSLAALGG